MKRIRQRRLGPEITVGDTTVVPIIDERGVEISLGGLRFGVSSARAAAVRVASGEQVSQVAVPDASRWARVGLFLGILVLATTRRNR